LGVDFRPLASANGAPDRPRGLPENDAVNVDSIEAELEQARTALSALEEGAASARLARVETALLSHPHLPQAAFLMSECLALQAQAARERSPLRAAWLDARRAALEGPRAQAFGEARADVASAHLVALEVGGLAERDELELDGQALGARRRVALAPGLHHARVRRRGHLVFAAFSEVVPEQSAFPLAVPELVPCSAEDLALAGAATTPDVACARWAKARAEPGGVGVALCEHERCGAFVHWQHRAPEPFAPLPVERRALPSWAGAAIAGAAIAVAGTLVLWQSGAFDRSRPSAASWEYGGLNPQALRF
jgi:hypothetical protein